ncbi:Short-chain dehydrogenase reductase SAT3 [Hyphodiscus hymeniophilus]|uniref:Short-chain dehydrogenase reductase SAT3 n=1 Tax=Hyphodiscus hymeniophilus TaxID=353542 RepID=A0A9P7B144_9HELO|nr:Short-chain dehydrogenase reductase SAT3 [Hyphodiscus hymeniophilus]
MSSIEAANLFSVKGLVAVVTGGGTGIGLMMAKALEANGAKVYIVGRRLEVLEKASKEAKHGNLVPLQCDVTSKADLSKIADHITKADGFINVLIANSGIQGPAGLETLDFNSSITEIQDFLWKPDVDDFTSAYRVNASAVYYSVVAFLGLLEAGNRKGNVEQKSQVITTSSISGFDRQPNGGFAYCTSKAASTHLMKEFATVMAPHHLRFNILAPGIYPSEMAADFIDRLFPDGTFPKTIIPLERAGSIEDMAGAILFLTSRAGAYLNGNVLVTDGGRLSVTQATY